MGNDDQLFLLRAHEVDVVAKFLPPNSRILEIGGGNGFQASRLQKLGHDVVSIDVKIPKNTTDLKVPIVEYDGKNIPAPDKSFDVVFSSNVLEHVEDLHGLNADVRRVLRDGGTVLHVVPTPVWRFWTSVAHYPFELGKAYHLFRECIVEPRSALPGCIYRGLKRGLRHIIAARFPSRHGEVGSAVSELYYFSDWSWRSRFKSDRFAVTSAHDMGLFYTFSNRILPRK
jgi:SAM-dependent methyltransferase